MNKYLKFARVFSAGMVLQRDTDFFVWGFGARGRVRVELIGECMQTAECTAEEDGSFCAVFSAVSGGDSCYSLRAVCENERIAIENIRFGDVYLLLGQSNMSYCLGAVERRDEWARRAADTNVCFLSLHETFSDITEVTRPVSPQRDLSREFAYVYGDAEKIKSVSAIGVIAAALLCERAGVPVGIIDTSMGGLSVEAYLPREYAEENRELLSFLKRVGRYDAAETYNTAGGRNFTQLAGVYNEKIAALARFKFRAAVWYLGESSAFDFEHAQYFEQELRAIVGHYRKLFGEIAFAAVQIAPEYYPYGDRNGYLYVNESIASLSRELPAFFAIPTYHIPPRWLIEDGDVYYHPIHPVNKEPIARMLADVLYKNVVCKERYVFPQIRSVQPDGAGGLLCTVADCGAGLNAERELYGFCVCGEDGKYYPAAARVTAENAIRLTSSYVPRPQDATYAFAQYQAGCNAQLKTGEPLLPFRSRRENANRNYYPLPPFLAFNQSYVLENCFGYAVGISRPIRTWEPGRIYGAKCRVAQTNRKKAAGVLKITAAPSNANYYFFGASPRVCLSGCRSGLADYPYLHAEASASAAGVEFYGLVVRLSSGDVFRFAPLQEGALADCVPVSERGVTSFCLDLKRAFREDSAVVTLSAQDRDTVAEAELLFRSKNPCTVTVQNLCYVPQAETYSYRKTSCQSARSDTQLPVSNDSV